MKRFIFFPAILMILITGCHIIVEEVYSPASRLVGSYEVDEWSDTYAAQAYFNIFINDDPNSPDIIYISNFYDSGIEVWGTVNGSRVRIPIQVAGPYEIGGSGSYYAGELNIDYSVRDVYSHAGIVDFCNAICIKR